MTLSYISRPERQLVKKMSFVIQALWPRGPQVSISEGLRPSGVGFARSRGAWWSPLPSARHGAVVHVALTLHLCWFFRAFSPARGHHC